MWHLGYDIEIFVNYFSYAILKFLLFIGKVDLELCKYCNMGKHHEQDFCVPIPRNYLNMYIKT